MRNVHRAANARRLPIVSRSDPRQDSNRQRVISLGFRSFRGFNIKGGSSMKRLLCGLALTSFIACSFLIGGCGEDNEKAAAITGQAPEGGGPKSQAEISDRLRGAGAGLKAEKYPRAKQ
jgi:hypothetical protein